MLSVVGSDIFTYYVCIRGSILRFIIYRQIMKGILILLPEPFERIFSQISYVACVFLKLQKCLIRASSNAQCEFENAILNFLFKREYNQLTKN